MSFIYLVPMNSFIRDIGRPVDGCPMFPHPHSLTDGMMTHSTSSRPRAPAMTNRFSWGHPKKRGEQGFRGMGRVQNTGCLL